MEKLDLQIRLESECPIFFEEYRDMILSVIEDYIYIPDFTWRSEFISNSFNGKLLKLEIESSELLKEIDLVKNIVVDIAYWKYIQKLDII